MLRPLDEGYVDPEPFGKGRIVCEVQRRVFRRGAVRRENRLEPKPLRRLSAPESVPGNRARDAPVRPALQRVCDGQGRQRPGRIGEGGEYPVDEGAVDKGSRRIVDQNQIWLVLHQSLKARPHAVLAAGPAISRREKMRELPLAGQLIKRLVIGMNHDQ